MSLSDSLIEFVTERSALVIAVMLLLTLVMGAGAAQLDQSPGLDQFEFETEESDALAYIQENFSVQDNQTAIQIVLRDQDNALSRASFIETIELQQELATDPDVEPSLADEPFQDLGSIVATEAMRAERGAELQAEATSLEAERDAATQTAANLTELVNATRDTQIEYTQLNASYEAGEIDESTYQTQAAALESELEDLEAAARPELADEEFAAFQTVLADARAIQSELVQTELAYQAGELTAEQRDAEQAQLSEDMAAVYERIETEVLADRFAELSQRADELQAAQADLQTLDPDREAQIEQLESMSDEEVAALVEQILGPDAPPEAFVFVPTDFEPGETEADARTMFVSQQLDEEVVEGAAPAGIVESQLAISDTVDERFGDGGFAFGVGILSDEIDRSMGDSLGLVIPLALLFVVVVLSIAYRDVLDILLGMLGIGLVLTWTFGFIGWAGITFNQIMIAVPVLLVGLSIDYAIHVFMRHRERRAEGDPDTRQSMAVVLVGLGLALVWVTATAMIGFLSNLVSPVPPIREFGIVSAFGILSTLLIFGLFVPAAKVSLDRVLEARGFDRRKRAFGTGGGSLTRVLAVGKTAATRAPWAVVAIALLLTAGGVAGAVQVDTAFSQEDFIADDPPDWMKDLPEPFAPGDYHIKAQLDYVNERFIRQDVSTQVLIRGELTEPETLERIREAEDAAAEEPVVATLSTGDADVESPLTAMERLADQDEEFAETFAAADTNGDDIPDQDLAALYDAFFEAAPDQAGQFLHRTVEGDYEAARMRLSIDGDATSGDATDATRRVADGLDDEDRSAIATGQLVVFSVIEGGLFDAVIESLLVTLVAVFLVLMAAYRVVHGSAILGAVTLMPIVLAVAWILGTMYLLDIPFNVITGTITSLTVGLGVAYNVHITERFRLEQRLGHAPADAMHRAVTGTGGALLGSAATTVGGFGVLVFAILPPLQQFGLITGLTIVYAFLASVFVLPSFLLLWSRYLGVTPPAEGDQPASEPARTQ